ncbi:MAG: response regulator [Candidatus Thiodiazotropha sp. (ex Dulcina madagascariensis)]|nr:response regulator [Candidatus Thiodiazotropha sp. (ex Epidulcina cf. delphinae)]MCU7923410.1 response regulator [Candidatus Thiodiazotropha sp. (ex Dulcina madagascariensis)]MCU7928820.1 response regulator [Candidatus Thiodiazotropha sp. (ex Dulcina madagascariensis)]
MRVLIVEDDPRIIEDIAASLETEGYLVDQVGDGEAAWFKGSTESYSAVILDLGLPGMDGLSVLNRWRAEGLEFPVLILTARSRWNERVKGIDAGADDYLSKPFQMEELLARLRAVIRRSAGKSSSQMQVGVLTLDTLQLRISVDGKPVHLSPHEYRLVSYLMLHAGRVVSQSELTEQIYAQGFERDSNSVEVLVGRVRRKLGSGSIQTRRGFGYIIKQSEP